MPLTISLPTDIAKALSKLAVAEYRSPQQQATWLLKQAVLQAVQEHNCPQGKPPVAVAAAPDAEEPDHATASAP